MNTRTILRGKQWGILGACLPYVVSFAAVALPISLMIGVAAAAWTILWLAATIFAGLYVTAVGIWCSARTQHAWQSLLLTLAVGYGSWIAIFFPVGMAVVVFRAFLGAILGFLDWLFSIDSLGAAFQSIQPAWVMVGLVFIAAFWFLTERLLVAAERQIAKRDRGKDVDPQYERFHARWLRKVLVAARVQKPIDPALYEQPLPVPPDDEEAAPITAPPSEARDDSDALLPVPDALNPLRDYNQPV